MKKLTAIFLIIGTVFAAFSSAQAQEKIEVQFFYSPTCSVCDREKPFLNDLVEKYPQIKLNSFSITEKENAEKLKVFYREYEVPEKEWGLVPATFVNNEFFIGFNTNGTTAQAIENSILSLEKESDAEPERLIKLPFFGEIGISHFSPLVLAVLLGGLDGFNPCAMVILGFLLAMLVATGIRERVFLVGGVFILVSGLVYFVFIASWLNLFLVLGQIKIITVGAGIAIILFGLFLMKDYLSGVICKICKVDEGETDFFTKIERFLFEKMQKVSEKDMPLPLLLLSVAIIAAGINLVELVCSLGLPLAFTKTLTNMQLPTASYYFYILIYTIFYMIDDFALFLIAVFTLRSTGMQDKYLRSIKLISAFVLVLLGLALIFKPGLLAI